VLLAGDGSDSSAATTAFITTSAVTCDVPWNTLDVGRATRVTVAVPEAASVPIVQRTGNGGATASHTPCDGVKESMV
jgi:hypothetical protein